MGAGLSKDQEYKIVYRELNKIRRELRKAGVSTVYTKRQLIYLETPDSPGGGFNVKFHRHNASNGECCLYPVIHISTCGCPGVNGDWRGWWDEHPYERGLSLVKELFSKRTA